MNIAAGFLATARGRPELPFVIDRDDTVHTYGAVHAEARRVATHLAAAGVRPGDRVVLSVPAGADFVRKYLGVLLAGAIAVLVDHQAGPARVEFARTDTGAVACLDARPVPAGGPTEPSRPAGDAPVGNALIVYTSGTTGVPKGVVLSHANLRHTVASIRSWAGVREGERELVTLPLTHLFGLAHLHLHWGLGGAVVLEDGLRDLPRLLRRLAAHRVTCLAGTPSGFRLLLDGHADRFRSAAATLRYLVINSAPLPVPDAERLLRLLPWVRCYTYYGLTEASRSTALNLREHPGRLRTAGRPTPGCEIVIGHPDAPLVGVEGEVLVRGPHVTRGYWGRAEEPLTGGWWRTADLGLLDVDGYLTWTGRLAEQINVAGLKVSPTAVEAVLRVHPSVVDAAVAGTSSPVTGEQVVGFVVSRDPASPALALDIRRFCRARLRPHEVPRRIEFVDRIPRTESGKVQSRLLPDTTG